MPISTPFTALGRGNGFPFCPAKTNVSNHARWITLGGTQKGNSATDDEKKTSFINAVKIFWNTNKPSGSPTNSKGGGLGDIIIRTGGSTGDPLEPIDRACRRANDVRGGANASGSSGDESFRSIFSTSAFIGLFIFRMYDGSTNDEDNFVGYGWSGISFASSVDDSPGINPPADAEAGNARSSIQMQSAFFSLYSPDESNFAYTTISGIPIAVFVTGDADQSAVDGSSSTSLNASSASASGVYSNDFCSGSVSTNISDLDFYTY